MRVCVRGGARGGKLHGAGVQVRVESHVRGGSGGRLIISVKQGGAGEGRCMCACVHVCVCGGGGGQA